MKKIYFLSILSLISLTLWSQTKTWTGSSGNWNTPLSWTPQGVPTANNNIIFNTGAAVTITDVPTIQLNRITVAAGSDITLRGIPGGSTITLNDGSGIDLTVNAGSSLIMSNNFNLEFNNSADATIAGVLEIGIDRVYSLGNGNSITTVAGTGAINNRGIINHSSSSVLSFSNGGTYLHDQNGGVVPDANWDNNSNCRIIGVTTTAPTNFEQDFGNFEWNCINQTAALSLGGNLEEIDGNLRITSTGTGSTHLANSVSSHTTTVGGDYIQTGGTFVITHQSGLGTLNLKGNFNMSGGVLARNGGTSNILFSDNGEQTFTKTGGTLSGSLQFTVQSGSAINFGTSVLDGAASIFDLESGAKIITSHPAGLNSAGATGSIQTATRDFDDEATYEFRGPVTGIFNTGTSTNATPSIVSNLIINNTSGAVTLSKPVTVANNASGTQRLYLQNGALITTATNILTLNHDVQATGIPALSANQYNLNSFVDGPMRKIGGNDFIFPVGKVGMGLHKIGIDITGMMPNNTTTFTAQYFRADPNAFSSTLGTGLTRISSCEYWTLDRAGSNQARVILSWENNSGCSGAPYVTDPLTLSVARLNGAGTSWVNETRLNSTGNNTAGTITSGNVINNFSPFTLASSSAANPLPVVFGDVKAYEKNNGVQIDWSNLTEKDVAEYTIERSHNGKDFTAIATQWPTSNQDNRAEYAVFDPNPLQSTNYYRIKVVETTGKIVYSKILSININRNALGLILYPNPVKDNQVMITLSNIKRGPYNLRVVSATGQDIFRKTILNQSSSFTQTVDLPASVKPGVYNMIITADGYRATKMFIVQ